MIPLSIPDLSGREAEYLARCVADNWISSAGPFVAELERTMAQMCGRKTSVAVSNGTVALQLALQACNLQRGDIVIVPDLSFAATVNAVIHAGGIPYFSDVEPEYLTLCPSALDSSMADASRQGKVAAVIAVDVLGNLADFPAISAICRRHDVKLIEDAAGSIGCRSFGKAAGNFGDAATFSFNGNKVVTGGGGGLVLLDDDSAAQRIRHLSTQARVGQRYQHDDAGFNFRLTNLNAAVAIAQLERLETIMATRQNMAARYQVALAGHPHLKALPMRPDSTSNHWLYPVICKDFEAAARLVAHCAGAGIEARHFWEQLSTQAPYRNFLGGECPNALRFSGSLVSLPSSTSLSETEQEKVIEIVRSWRG